MAGNGHTIWRRDTGNGNDDGDGGERVTIRAAEPRSCERFRRCENRAGGRERRRCHLPSNRTSRQVSCELRRKELLETMARLTRARARKRRKDK